MPLTFETRFSFLRDLVFSFLDFISIRNNFHKHHKKLKSNIFILKFKWSRHSIAKSTDQSNLEEFSSEQTKTWVKLNEIKIRWKKMHSVETYQFNLNFFLCHSSNYTKINKNFIFSKFIYLVVTVAQSNSNCSSVSNCLVYFICT